MKSSHSFYKKHTQWVTHWAMKFFNKKVESIDATFLKKEAYNGSMPAGEFAELCIQDLKQKHIKP